MKIREATRRYGEIWRVEAEPTPLYSPEPDISFDENPVISAYLTVVGSIVKPLHQHLTLLYCWDLLRTKQKCWLGYS